MFDDYEQEEELEVLCDITIVTKTKAAVLIRKTSGSEAWFPKSVVIKEYADAIDYESWFEPNWSSLTKKSFSAIEGDF